MLFQLLTGDTNATNTGNNVFTYIFLGVIIVAFVVFLILSNKRAKKREQETQSMLDAIKPGNKVKTIGGICGIVVEVNSDDNTFVLETGSENNGKCYIKFDKQAVYQTDAKSAAEEKTAEKVEPETEAAPEEKAASAEEENK